MYLKVILYDTKNDSKYRDVAPLKLPARRNERTKIAFEVNDCKGGQNCETERQSDYLIHSLVIPGYHTEVKLQLKHSGVRLFEDLRYWS